MCHITVEVDLIDWTCMRMDKRYDIVLAYLK